MRKRFELSDWLKDKSQKVVTRDGKPARVICWDRKDKLYPVIALIDSGCEDSELQYSYTKEGLSIEGCENWADLFIETDEVEIPFGAYDSELIRNEWTIPEGYTAKIEDGKVIVEKKEVSEDEIVIGALKSGIKRWQNEGWKGIGGVKIDKIFAWLEKQGTSYTKRDVDDAYVEGMAFAKDEFEKQGKKPNPYSGTSFEYNGHSWGMCARDGGVEITIDGELKTSVFAEQKGTLARPLDCDYENANIQQKDSTSESIPKNFEEEFCAIVDSWHGGDSGVYNPAYKEQMKKDCATLFELAVKEIVYDEPLDADKVLSEDDPVTTLATWLSNVIMHGVDAVNKGTTKYFNTRKTAKEILDLTKKEGMKGFPKWKKNREGNKPQIKRSVLMLTKHDVAEGEWLGEDWCQYRWSCKLKDEEVLYWMHLSDLKKLEKEE